VSEPAPVRVSELRMEGVGKRRGSTWAVRDISLAVRPGELYALLGPAASGKTTLLRLIAGFIRPDAGRLVVDDAPIDSVPPWRRNIGMVFQECALWPHLSAFEHVAYGLRARGESGAPLARKVEAVLAQLGLEGLGAHRPARLSAAQRRRLALARALIVGPRLLLLDEPLADVDAAERAPTRLELGRLIREAGITTMYATREQADALALATRVAVLSGGRVVQEGRPEEIYWKPRSRVVAQLAGAANLVPVRVVELREVGVVVQTAGGARLPVASGGHAWAVGARGLLCLRPEALRVEEAALAPGGIPGQVVSQVFEGSRLLYEVDIAGSTVRVEVLASAAVARGLKPGDHVKIEVSAETSVLLPEDGPGSA
jgi:ABC-type Fe3+/spermidine/putrescine transport system ATPase subunit